MGQDWRYRTWIAEEGVDGLVRDKTRKPGKMPLSVETIAKVLALSCAEPPGESTHWTGRMVAKAVDISLSALQRLWETHRLQRCQRVIELGISVMARWSAATHSERRGISVTRPA